MTGITTPKHILMTADTLGGVWTYVLELARGLASWGIRISLATMGAPLSADQAAEAARLPNLEVFPSGYRLEWMANPWKDVDAAGEWLLKLEERLHPDLVHLNGYSHAALPWNVPALVVAHSCVISWWEAVHEEPAPAEWAEYRRRIAAGLRAADAVVAPSQAFLQVIERLYGPLPLSTVIPNARQLRPRLRDKEPFILAAGRLWDEAKNIRALAAAADGLPWPVLIAGKAEAPDGSTARFPNVQRLGHLSMARLQPWFERAGIYAFPALYEPFGLSILEAALCGCALVLGDIPSLRETWGNAASYVPPRDVEAIAQRLRTLISRPRRRTELADRARARAGSYTISAQARSYLELYQLLLARPGGSTLDITYAIPDVLPFPGFGLEPR